MICPRCQTRNELGANSCASCGAPFTRRAARQASADPRGQRHNYNYHQTQSPAHAAPGFAQPPAAAPRRQRRVYRRNTGPGNRAIGGLIALLIITIVIISGAAILGSGDTSGRISEGLSGAFSGLVGSSDDSTPDVEVPETPDQPLGDQTWILTQEELNQRIAQNPDALSPAQDVNVELGEGTVTVRFRAYGVNGTYHGTLTTRDGVPVVADSTIDGAIGWVVSSGRIDDVLNQQMAAVVSEQNVSVESVHVRPGEMVFGIS